MSTTITKQPLLSIILPTNRDLLTSIPAISAVLAAVSNDIEIIICDDSEKPDKIAFLRSYTAQHPNRKLVLNSVETTAMENYTSGFEAASGLYVLSLGDDDYLSQDFINDTIDTINSVKQPTCILPNIIKANSTSPPVISTPPVNGGDWKERILTFHNSFPTGPYTPFGATPRNLIATFLEYVNQHPFKPNYLDWFFEYFVRANCDLKIVKSGFYLYKSNNWTTPETIVKSDQNHWMRAKFPEWFVIYHHLIWAIDQTLFISSYYFPGTLEDRQQLADYLFRWRIREFCILITREKRHIFETAPLPKEIKEMTVAIVNKATCELDEAFALIHSALCVFDPSQADRYSNFANQMVTRISPELLT